MIIFYPFLRAFSPDLRWSKFLNRGYQFIRIPSSGRVKPYWTYWLLSVILVSLSLLTNAQGKHHASHRYYDYPQQVAVAKNGLFSATLVHTPNISYSIRIEYLNFDGLVKSTATLSVYESSDVRAMISTIDQGVVIAGFANGCDFSDNRSHYYIAKLDSNGTLLFMDTLLKTTNSFLRPNLFEHSLDSSYRVLISGLNASYSKSGQVNFKTTFNSLHLAQEQTGNTNLFLVNNNNTVYEADAIGQQVSITQTLQGSAQQIQLSSNNSVFVKTTQGIEKFSPTLQAVSVFTIGNQITTFDINNDTLYIGGTIGNAAFLVISDTAFNVISQYTTATDYIRPVSIAGIAGRRACLALQGNNPLLNTQRTSIVVLSSSAGEFAFTHDLALVGLQLLNAYHTAGQPQGNPPNWYLQVHLDFNATVRNNSNDTVKTFWLSADKYSLGGFCGSSFFHKYYSVVIPPQGTVVVNTGEFSRVVGTVSNTLLTSYSVEPVCLYSSIPNWQADYFSENDYQCYQFQSVQVVTGTETIETKAIIFELLPNPAGKNITIHTGVAEPFVYSIYDLNGRKQLEGRADALESNVDITQLPPGVYVVSVICNQQIQQKKLVIQ